MGLRAALVPAGDSERVAPDRLADQVYERLKDDLWEFRLLPGERFTEADVAQRTGASRTPVRQALYRLQREGFVDVRLRSGWQVRPFDFQRFEALYDVRIVLELAAVERLCTRDRDEAAAALAPLRADWLAPPARRLRDGGLVARMDEEFHCGLVAAAGNAEMALIHRDVTEKIRIVRRLDFTKAPRIDATYDEHAAILRAVLAGRGEQARWMLKSHIGISKAEVRKITLHRLYSAREAAGGAWPAPRQSMLR